MPVTGPVVALPLPYLSVAGDAAAAGAAYWATVVRWLYNQTRVDEPLSAPVLESMTLDALTAVNVRERSELLVTRRLVDHGDAVGQVLDWLASAVPADGSVDLAAGLLQLARQGRLPAGERRHAHLLLGVTDKGLKNLGSADARARVVGEKQGELTGGLDLTGGGQPALAAFLRRVEHAAVGAGTLAIRGSQKSWLGKTLERSVLTAVMALGAVPQIAAHSADQDGFWLSTGRSPARDRAGSEDREIDMVVRLVDGSAVVVDIGFITATNSEMTKDKLTRYRHKAELAGRTRQVRPVIVVDGVPPGSTAWNLAREAQVRLLQMQDVMWAPQMLVRCGRGSAALALRQSLAGVSEPAARQQVVAQALHAAGHRVATTQRGRRGRGSGQQTGQSLFDLIA